MIKRLIFDLDDTLIIWKKEYEKIVNMALEDLNYPYTQKLCDDINNAETEYEANIKYFNKKEMLNYINKKLNINLPLKFMDKWLEKASYCVPEKLDDKTYDILEYLSKKYDLVILTNWFTNFQIERLKLVGIQKYFKEIYGAEKYAKPQKESYIQAMGKNLPEECAAIGDNLIKDLEPARQVGIKKLVWKNNHHTNKSNKKIASDIEIITELSELKKIF